MNRRERLPHSCHEVIGYAAPPGDLAIAPSAPFLITEELSDRLPLISVGAAEAVACAASAHCALRLAPATDASGASCGKRTTGHA